MGENSGIEWTDHTFNPWIGCTRVSPACDHCYAETVAHRFKLAEWGTSKPRRLAHDDYWKQPLAWNRKALKRGIRRRVFCASLADVFDNEVPEEWRVRLFELIELTPQLDWLLLTKRIGNARSMMPITPMPNVWLGISVVNQDEADRDIPKLLATPARTRFLSMEPLLGRVSLRNWLPHHHPDNDPSHPVTRDVVHAAAEHFGGALIDWVIVGGESGHDARPMHPEWARSLRDQCKAAGVPYFFKQWGEWAPHKPVAGGDLGGDVRAGRVMIVHPTGQSAVEVFQSTGRSTIEGSRYMARIGKKAAGRLLDGRTWDDLPIASAA